MAQSGFTPIQIYSSSTASSTPAAGSLMNSAGGSELAINITDGKLFYKDNSDAVQVIGWKIVPASAGGTGQTSYTDGQLLIGNSTGNTLTKATLTAGTGVSITNGAGSITISATGGTGTVTSVSGTSPISVANGTTTPVISISQAGTSTNGYLSSTDWNTFNGKGSGSVTSVSGTGTVNGLTLTGTVTTSGSLTLGGTLSGIGNSQLTNSTISGVALGGNLFSLTAGTGVSFSSGTTYNGSVAITINATGSGGTVTSVSGTGTVNGLTLTGTVTSSGSLTLGGTLDLSSPPTIGNTTAAAITGTTVTANTKFVSSYYDASGSGGGSLRTSSGTACLQWGAGGGVNLTLDGAFNMNPANYNISIAPTGTGTLTVNPATLGTLDNMTIGATTPSTIKGTTITATTGIGGGNF